MVTARDAVDARSPRPRLRRGWITCEAVRFSGIRGDTGARCEHSSVEGSRADLAERVFRLGGRDRREPPRVDGRPGNLPHGQGIRALAYKTPPPGRRVVRAATSRSSCGMSTYDPLQNVVDVYIQRPPAEVDSPGTGVADPHQARRGLQWTRRSGAPCRGCRYGPAGLFGHRSRSWSGLTSCRRSCAVGPAPSRNRRLDRGVGRRVGNGCQHHRGEHERRPQYRRCGGSQRGHGRSRFDTVAVLDEAGAPILASWGGSASGAAPPAHDRART